MEQARKIAEEGVPLSELTDRMDLTGMDIFTIDSADSKDLDDAVSLQRDDEHWYLGVHIADVSHYVRPGTPLDLEAYRRGTSIYYADQVIPMLPKELSNGICSLNPDEVRLTFSALVTLKLSGEIEGFRFVKSYIRSRVKGVYAEINTILKAFAETNTYGTILRSKGIVALTDGSWIEFDLVPEETEVRETAADFTGRICVIGTDLKEDEIKKAFHI